MCKFLAFVTNGKTDRYYFNAKQRKAIKGRSLEQDSHSSICTYFHLKEDKCNKYEYNPLIGEFTIDQINNTSDDSASAEKWIRGLDIKSVVPELIIKPIINSFKIEPPVIDEKILSLLREWTSVRDSFRGSVGDSVGDSVLGSVGASVWDSVRASVWASVLGSVWDSVRNSVWAYISSFFILQEWKYIDTKNGENPFQSCINLWEMGLIPSFDGTIWRLHDKNGIVWKGEL